MSINKNPLTKPFSKHPLGIKTDSWIQTGLDNAARERSLLKYGPKLVADLISLIQKYATEACQCDIMYGYQCKVHEEVREDIKRVLDRYEYRKEV